MTDLKEIINNQISNNFTILNINKKKEIDIFDNVYENITLEDIFHKLDCEYLFIITNKNNFSSIFSIYQDSYFEFYACIPWLTLAFSDTSFTNVINKFKDNFYFVLVFSKSTTKNIKPYLQGLIIEPYFKHSINDWIKTLICDLNSAELKGIYVNEEGTVIDNINEKEFPFITKNILF